MSATEVGAIRDKNGKLIGTFRTVGGEDNAPSFLGPFLPADYSIKTILETPRYNQQVTALKNEASNRRTEELARQNAAQIRVNAGIEALNKANKLVSITRNNPFITNPNVSRLYSKQSAEAYRQVSEADKERIDAAKSAFLLDFPQDAQAIAEKQYQENMINRDFGSFSSYNIGGQPADYLAGIINNIPYNQTQQQRIDAQIKSQTSGRGGLIIAEKPPNLTKAESLDYNKKAIEAQLPYIAPKNFYVDQNTGQTKSYFLEKSNVPKDVIVSNPSKTEQRISFGKEGLQNIKNAVNEVTKAGQAFLVYTDSSGMQKNMPVKNSNEAIRAISKEAKKGAQGFSITSFIPSIPEASGESSNERKAGAFAGARQDNLTPEEIAVLDRVNGVNKEIQGPIRPEPIEPGAIPFPFQQAKDKVVANGLEEQRPALDNSGIFVGSLTAASEQRTSPLFSIEAKQTIEPRPTVSDFIGNNPISKFIDDSFELDKPLTQRSDEPRRIGDISPKIFAGYSNREIGELITPFSNKAIEAIDTFRATGEGLQGRESFEWKKDSFGIPHLDPIRKTPTPQNTVSKQLSEGKIPDFTDKNVRYGSYGNFFEIASEFAGLSKGVKIGLKTAEKLEDFSQKAKVTNIAKKTSEGKIYGIEKLGTDTFAIKRGTEGRGEIGISNKINPSLVVSKFKNRVEAFMSDTPKNVKIPKAQDPAKYDLGIVEFNKPDIVGKVKYTEYQKAKNLTPEKQGTPFTVLGEVPRVTQSDFGLIDKGNKIYSGLMSEKNINKLLEAERQGFINPVAIGKTAPAKAILKNDAELLREYALGSKQLRSKIYDTKPNEIGKQNEFIIGDYNTPLPRPIIKVGSEGLDRLLNRFVGKSTITGTAKAPKRAFRKLRPFDLDISEGKGVAGGSGKSASLTETEVNKIIDVVKTGIKPTSKAKPEPISLPFALESFSSIVTYPQNTPQSITQTPASKFSDSVTNTLTSDKIVSGLETPQRSKRIQFTISPQRSNQSERLTPFVIPRGITRQTPSILPILAPIESTRQTPITPQRTDQPFKYDLITELITTPIFDIPRPPPREPPITFTPLPLRGIGFPFAGFGGGIGEGRKPKKGKKKYLASSADEFTPGVLAQAGVQTLRVGRTSKVYGIQDRAIRKARKKNTPKYKSVLDKPI